MARSSASSTVAAIVSVLMLIAGLGALIFGLGALLIGPGIADGPPTCDGQAMGPGDRCFEEFNGQTDVVSYEEIVRRQESGQGVHQVVTVGGALAGGGAVLSLGGWWISRRTGHGRMN
jgi:hypothetical protein